MYRFSRSIYRELGPLVIEDPRDTTGCANKQKVLDSCEATIRRLAYDRRYFARPARSLFNEVRVYFAIGDQLHAWRVIERNISLAINFIEQMPEELGIDSELRQCRAHTRKGTPCQRDPLPGRDYCPSHKHLEETFDSAELPIGDPASGGPTGVISTAA